MIVVLASTTPRALFVRCISRLIDPRHGWLGARAQHPRGASSWCSAYRMQALLRRRQRSLQRIKVARLAARALTRQPCSFPLSPSLRQQDRQSRTVKAKSAPFILHAGPHPQGSIHRELDAPLPSKCKVAIKLPTHVGLLHATVAKSSIVAHLLT